MKHVFKAFAIVVLCTVGIDAACKQYSADKNCPQDTPCCKDGWCSNDPSFCSVGCQPENSFSPKSCFPTAYCVNKYDDFTTSTLINAQNFSGNPLKNDWTSDFTPDYATVQDGNLVLSMKYDPTKKNDAGNYAGFGSTVSTTRWMEYGRVSARIKTASSKLGVVSSFITRNLEGDEIDFEWVGLNPNEAQSNFYYKGVLNYGNAVHTDIGSDSSADYHTYEIEWMPDYTTWYVDGKTARTLTRESTKASNGTYLYPTGPQRIQFSVWDGGQGLKGTADWAGTPTDWSDQNRVYTMFVDWVNITCLYQGNETTQWPPAGYGPPTPANSSSNPYQTIGTGTPGTGGDGSPGSAAAAQSPTIPPSDSGAIHSTDSSVTFGVFSLLAASLIASMMFTSKNL